MITQVMTGSFSIFLCEGEPASREAHGFLATVFQHEFDHLGGVLYVDRLKDPSLFAFEEEYTKFHIGD